MYCTVLLQYFYQSKHIGTRFSTKTNILRNVCTLRLLPLSPKEEVRTGTDPWLEACMYACARLGSMAMHAYARLHSNTLHTCVRLGLGTQSWTSCIVMHRFFAEKKLVLVEFLFNSTVCRKGTSGAFRSKKCARLRTLGRGDGAHLRTLTTQHFARLRTLNPGL